MLESAVPPSNSPLPESNTKALPYPVVIFASFYNYIGSVMNILRILEIYVLGINLENEFSYFITGPTGHSEQSKCCCIL